MRSKRIVIVDYGVGNTCSVAHAISCLGYNVKISDQLKHIQDADALILPGVGAFNEAMKNLKARGLDEMLDQEVVVKKKPVRKKVVKKSSKKSRNPSEKDKSSKVNKLKKLAKAKKRKKK